MLISFEFFSLKGRVKTFLHLWDLTLLTVKLHFPITVQTWFKRKLIFASIRMWLSLVVWQYCLRPTTSWALLKDAAERSQIIREPWPFNKNRETAYSLSPSLFIPRGRPQDNQYIKAKIFISQITKTTQPYIWFIDPNICRVKWIVVLNPPQTFAILLACSLNFSLQISRASK